MDNNRDDALRYGLAGLTAHTSFVSSVMITRTAAFDGIDFNQPGGVLSVPDRPRRSCVYCGGNSATVNIRGGEECPGCGAPR